MPGGISVIPTGEFELHFETSQSTGVIRIALTDGAELAVRAFGDSPGYDLAPEGVRVENVGSTADYEVLVPRSARRVTIRVEETVVFTKQDASIVTLAVEAERAGYLLDFAELRSPRPNDSQRP